VACSFCIADAADCFGGICTAGEVGAQVKALNFTEDYRQLNIDHEGREFGEGAPLHYHECIFCGADLECEADDNYEGGSTEDHICNDCDEEINLGIQN